MRTLILILVVASSACVAAPSKFQPVSEVPGPFSLESAPDWKVGEWWTLRVTDAFSGETKEVTRVVADVHGDEYLVGMPTEQFFDDLLALHIPGFGNVARSNLSFQVHNRPFSLIEFPAREGDTWVTSFEGGTMGVTVHVVSETIATMELGGGWGGSATYDAALHEFSHVELEGYATIDVVGHGYNHIGPVTVPHHETLVYGGSRFVAPVQGTRPAGPTETANVNRESFTRASFVALAVNAVNGPTGLYSVRITTPDGVVHEHTVLPGEAAGYHQRAFRTDHPGGTWTFEYYVGGPGSVLAEVLAYHAMAYDLGRNEAKD